MNMNNRPGHLLNCPGPDIRSGGDKQDGVYEMNTIMICVNVHRKHMIQDRKRQVNYGSRNYGNV